MYYLCLLSFLVAAYMLGSLNPAIIITKLKKGVDIRTLGTHNPGTANVSRNLGKSWGALVLFLDITKGLVPVIMARYLCFPESNIQNYAAVILTGMAAIAGHCRPLWYNFVGGGGIATSTGILLYLIPIEFFTSMLLGFALAMIFYGRKKYSISQITPMIFITLTPFITLALYFAGPVSIFGNLTLFEHEWYEVAGIFIISLLIFILNAEFIGRRLAKDDTRHN
jgi:glycerol-3-phosphate acyltransferase PlsY